MQHPPTYLPPWVLLLLFSIIRHAERSMTASRPGHRRQWLGRGKGGEDMATVPRNGTVSMLTGPGRWGQIGGGGLPDLLLNLCSCLINGEPTPFRRPTRLHFGPPKLREHTVHHERVATV